MPNHIFSNEVLFSIGQRSFFSFFLFAEAEAVVVEVEAEVKAVDRLAVSTSLTEGQQFNICYLDPEFMGELPINVIYCRILHYDSPVVIYFANTAVALL